MGELCQRIARRGAVLALVTLLGAFGAYALDDPFAPPENRIRPPIGGASISNDEVLSADLQSRISPAAGVAPARAGAPGDVASQNRISPPIGVAPLSDEDPSLVEQLWIWVQKRIGPPIG